MLQDAGVDPAELDVANGPITFDRLAEIANQLNETDDDGNYSQMGFAAYTHQEWHYTYGFAFGGTFFDEAACGLTPDDEGVVAGHQWLYDYVGGARPAEGQRLRRTPWAATVTVPEEQQSIHHPARRRSRSPATGT